MSKKILSKLETFINNEEDFLNKKILVLNFKHRKYFWFKNKRNQFFLKNLNNCCNFNEAKNFSQFISQTNKNNFDFIIIIKSNILKSDFINTMVFIQKKYCQTGTRIFIEAQNNQKVTSYILRILNFTKKRRLNLKRENLMLNEELLVYDYYYFCISMAIDFQHKSLIYKLFSIKDLFVKFIDFQRFYFLASRVLIKYQYVPKYSHKKTL